MSVSQKILKVLALVLWLVSVVAVFGAIHGSFKVGFTLSIAFVVVLSFAGLYIGWLAIKGANTPSAITALPVQSLVFSILAVIVGAFKLYLDGMVLHHSSISILVVLVLFTLIGFGITYASRLVKESVAL